MDDTQTQIITAYQPGKQARLLVSRTPLVLMVGVSGAGRDTIISRLIKRGGYYPLVTATTREPRVNNSVAEQHGVDYYFISPEEAMRNLRSGAYIEVSPVHGHINGLLIEELQRAHDSGTIAITDLDTQGARKYRQLSEEICAIYVLPPSYDEWLARVRQRYITDEAFQDAWPRRRQSAMMELEMAISDPFYDFVINDSLEQATEWCDRIAHGMHSSPEDNARGKKLAEEILARLRAS